MLVLPQRLRVVFISGVMATLCAGNILADSGKGIGPVKEIKVTDVNKDLAKKGKTIFSQKCSACHKVEERYVGPALKGITQRRQPEWVMNMILNPSEMLQNDPTAKGLLEEFLTPMTFQNVSQEDARAILEFFRAGDSGISLGDEKPKTKKK